MKEEVKEWINQSIDELETAKISFESKKYKASAFWCQQSVEKAFKAVMLEKSGKIIKTHDLVFLGKEINLPAELLKKAKELTQAYIYARYPSISEPENIRKIVSGFLEYTKEILEWTKKKL